MSTDNTMPFISDQTVYKAVCFALELKKSMPITRAVRIAAGYYKVAQREVAYYLGSIGGRKAAKNKIRRAYRDGYGRE